MTADGLTLLYIDNRVLNNHCKLKSLCRSQLNLVKCCSMINGVIWVVGWQDSSVFVCTTVAVGGWFHSGVHTQFVFVGISSMIELGDGVQVWLHIVNCLAVRCCSLPCSRCWRSDTLVWMLCCMVVYLLFMNNYMLHIHHCCVITISGIWNEALVMVLDWKTQSIQQVRARSNFWTAWITNIETDHIATCHIWAPFVEYIHFYIFRGLQSTYSPPHMYFQIVKQHAWTLIIKNQIHFDWSTRPYWHLVMESN